MVGTKQEKPAAARTRPRVTRRFACLGVLTLVAFAATVFFVEAALITGSVRWRLLMHDGELVIGIRVPAGSGASSGFTAEFTSNLLDITLLPTFNFGRPTCEVGIPLWTIVILAMIWAVLGWRRSRRRAAWQCASCGYDLRGASGASSETSAPASSATQPQRCPECGAARA